MRVTGRRAGSAGQTENEYATRTRLPIRIATIRGAGGGLKERDSVERLALIASQQLLTESPQYEGEIHFGPWYWGPRGPPSPQCPNQPTQLGSGESILTIAGVIGG